MNSSVKRYVAPYTNCVQPDQTTGQALQAARQHAKHSLPPGSSFCEHAQPSSSSVATCNNFLPQCQPEFHCTHVQGHQLLLDHVNARMHVCKQVMHTQARLSTRSPKPPMYLHMPTVPIYMYMCIYRYITVPACRHNRRTCQTCRQANEGHIRHVRQATLCGKHLSRCSQRNISRAGAT